MKAYKCDKCGKFFIDQEDHADWAGAKVQMPNGELRPLYIRTFDVCLPTKLIPAGDVKGDSVFYCERCLERAKETNTKVLLGSGSVQFDAPIHFDWSISKYCPDCGSRFTNITKGEDGRYTVIKEEN